MRRGVTALDWYTDQCCVDSAAVRLVGNQWRRADTSLAEDEGDEQPVDVAALVEALVEACTQTGGEHYGRQAVHASSGSSAATPTVYRCTTSPPAAATTASAPPGRARTKAESTLAYLQARLALEGAGLQRFVGREE